jgi:hypothetical protein
LSVFEDIVTGIGSAPGEPVVMEIVLFPPPIEIGCPKVAEPSMSNSDNRNTLRCAAELKNRVFSDVVFTIVFV